MTQAAVEPVSVRTNLRLSPERKVAILMVMLGEKLTAEIFKRLGDDEVKRVSQSISALGLVDGRTSEAVLNEFQNALTDGGLKVRGSLEYAKKAIEEAFAPETAREIVRYLAKTGPAEAGDGLKTIKYADPQSLAKLIQEEHPQTIAVVLAHLDSDQASEIIALLPDNVRCDIAVRLAQLDQISQAVRDKVTDVIAAKLRESGQYDQGSQGGLRKVADILNRMDRSISRGTLEAIESENPSLALAIRNLMFIFDDILLIGDADMRKVIQNIDKKVLVKALKGTAAELREHFYRNMSERAVEMIKEDMEATGPIRLKDADAARQEIVLTIREMETAGTIDLRGAGGDQYVV